MRLSVTATLFAVLLAFAMLVSSGVHASAEAQLFKQEPAADTDPGVSIQDFKKYIVSFKETASTATMDAVMAKVAQVGGRIVNQFSLIPGIVVEIPAQLATLLSTVPDVESVEEDKPMHALPVGI
ncbi:hypothetical protein HDU87_004164 [Geranomyces variabilis]|uniref:Inhibitor I9 domain-containing protein n=1 Tax=Geranomyces variabilis TaxID=109894 RepID=A0AAD5TL67_9FUNG|nr:hypothetical protein HDU87_004164 [Geranomyces variabilis]